MTAQREMRYQKDLIKRMKERLKCKCMREEEQR